MKIFIESCKENSVLKLMYIEYYKLNSHSVFKTKKHNKRYKPFLRLSAHNYTLKGNRVPTCIGRAQCNQIVEVRLRSIILSVPININFKTCVLDHSEKIDILF